MLIAAHASAAKPSGPEAVRVGEPATFTVTGAPPALTMTLSASPTLNRGSSCCGVSLGELTTDATGTATTTVTWPATYQFCAGSSHCSSYPWLAATADVAAVGDSTVTDLLVVDVDPAAGGVARPAGLKPNGREPMGLGVSVAKLFARWGRVDDYAEPGNGGIASYPFGVEATIKLRGARRVTDFTVFEGDWSTVRGAKLGTPRTELIRLYGKGLRPVRYRGRKFQTRRHYYVKVGPNALAFAMSRGKVTWMVARPAKGIVAFLTDQVGPI